MCFVVYFEDEAVQGKSLGEPDTGWNGLPDKPIHKLEYVNPYGEAVVLEGCAEYNHFIEVIQRMGGKPYLTRVLLMGANDTPLSPLLIEGKEGVATPLDRGEKRVRVYEIMLDEARLGQVVTKECARGTEYDGGPSWGWRKGVETQRHGGTED